MSKIYNGIKKIDKNKNFPHKKCVVAHCDAKLLGGSHHGPPHVSTIKSQRPKY